jgi:hypothetical protein
MKLAAILALVVAIMLGAWAIKDYRNNEEVTLDFVRQGITYIDLRNDTGADATRRAGNDRLL